MYNRIYIHVKSLIDTVKDFLKVTMRKVLQCPANGEGSVVTTLI